MRVQITGFRASLDPLEDGLQGVVKHELERRSIVGKHLLLVRIGHPQTFGANLLRLVVVFRPLPFTQPFEIETQQLVGRAKLFRERSE
jgi:hypothetical protein